jgi:hypothetical protein
MATGKKEAESGVNPQSSPQPLCVEQHYSPEDIGKKWGLSPQKVRKTFRDEPGVLTTTGSQAKRKTIRIPQSVVERVYRRLKSA